MISIEGLEASLLILTLLGACCREEILKNVISLNIPAQ